MPGNSRRKTTTNPPPERREELLATAAEVFAAQGYNATTVRKIADVAGILANSLYYHFDSKESMFDEILSRFLDDRWARYDAVLAAGLAPRETIEASSPSPSGRSTGIAPPSPSTGRSPGA
ncbi:TetR/AcrR family transcriptional regulator [Streptomyces sp. NPDC006274]|uniref:TetR/AcrR family transcriptional regulator n=1 Tax=unclassified Streptomyces TaxID=2593676 RepID=UPI0033ADEF86